MGITDKSRLQGELRRKAKAQAQQLKTQAVNSKAPTSVMQKIETLRQQAEEVDCETAYQHLMSRIHELSGQL